MLTYFPEIYPDELLYSVLGRLKCHCGILSAHRLMIDAFDRHNVQAGAFWQTDLWRLAANIPASRGLTKQRLAVETTLLPYMTAFEPQKVRDWAFAALTGDNEYARPKSNWLGRGDVRFPSILRYCPTCRMEMLKQRGELYWRREHQLPGVLVCSNHGSPLADSLVDLVHTGNQEYVAADELNCPPNPALPGWANQREVVELLMYISKASAVLLTSPPLARPLAAWGEEIQIALRARGFGRGRCGIDQLALRKAFLNQFGPIFYIMPDAAPDTWLLKIARKHLKGFAPIRHILFRRLIESLPMEVASNPFGPGPWPCRNSLAKHFGEPVITNCRLHKTTRGKTIGVFRCSCGYVFSTAADSANRARVLDRTQLFESRLHELVSAGTSLAGTARALHVTSGAVLYYASRLGLKTPWKVPPLSTKSPPIEVEAMRAAWTQGHTADPNMTRTQLRRKIPTVYDWLGHNDPSWLKMQPPASLSRIFIAPPVDWQTIDVAMVEALKREAARLRAEDPPKRVSRSSLERALGRRGRLGRLNRLPLTAIALTELLESTEEFQCRRIIWAAEELRRREQPISVRRLYDLTGLRSSICARAKSLLRKTAGLEA